MVASHVGKNTFTGRGGTNQVPGNVMHKTEATSQLGGHEGPPSKHSTYPHYAPHIPLSQRRAPPLDLSTVERRGYSSAARETRRVRPHGLQEAPTFRPSDEDFKDPFEYIRRIRPEAEKYGICKIIPPESWLPDFAINTERFFFRTRRQELNSIEGGTRTNIQYVDQLAKFHKQNGMNLNRFPSVDKRPLDLHRLKKAVESRGGFDKVCKLKKWAEIGRDLGYSGKIMSSLSTSLKNSYQKLLHPFEEYLRLAKPGVQQQLELESKASPSASKLSTNAAKSNPEVDDNISLRGATPNFNSHDLALFKDHDVKLEHGNTNMPKPTMASGFTPINASGFTPVNATPNAFTFVNSHDAPSKTNSHGSLGEPGFVERDRTTANAKGSFVAPVPVTEQTNGLKRGFGQSLISNANSEVNVLDFDDDDERRSKRLKKAPTVVGSHMNQFRPATPRILDVQHNHRKGEVCEVCGTKDDRSAFLICDGCDCGYHKNCLEHPARVNPLVDWHCPRCLVGTGDFGFEEGGIYSLRQFQEKARLFKENYFESRTQYDPVTNRKRAVSEEEVEREFWRLVESPSEEVEVEYGADIHSTTHGSGFVTMEKSPNDPFASNFWNLNILPLHPDSLFKHIKSDISGMTIPWLYVGMCFSTFCWHNEDHYCYSANYQHFGATKTWYGIPGKDAERFEKAMREAVPELFESQPDLLFQLVTLLPPDRLRKAGVNVYALDQRAGQFVITFPQAYHAGFNHGFNFNEAVNFAPDDWEPFGEAGVQRLQDFRRQPCFSHDELLLSAASRDTSIKTAKWLSPALLRLQDKEKKRRSSFHARHLQNTGIHRCRLVAHDGIDERCEIQVALLTEDLPETEYICSYCKAYSYLSSFCCLASGTVLCLQHVGDCICCESTDAERYRGTGHVVRYRMSDEELEFHVQKILGKSHQPDQWQDKLAKTIEEEERPSLKTLQSLVNEGDKIPWQLPGLVGLKEYVSKCNEWVDEAQHYITRKQQNRRKNEKAWRKGRPAAKADESEEKEKELRRFENMSRLIERAYSLSFDCPQIAALEERAQAVEEFRTKAGEALKNPNSVSVQELEELADSGKSFNVNLPEVDELEFFIKRQQWGVDANEIMQITGTKFDNLRELKDFIGRGQEAGIVESDVNMSKLKEIQLRSELWEAKAQELLSMEILHHPQLEALSSQADSLPINDETRSKIDTVLSKQREAQKQIQGLFQRSQDSDMRKRPTYKEARDACDGLSELSSKPVGTVDLENTLKRQENWMRKGKKLFGKANAPLHILQQHLDYVAEHNGFCFDLLDKPRMPVEPASRENSPVDGEELEGIKSEKNVFCMCRQAEAGTMLECERCLEWYHGKCLKIARGKVKEDDKYLCPICDYRVKIPRDAARPKLEDLILWQEEIPDLPFQPEEEAALDEIINSAQNFRDFLRPHVNPVATSSEELTTQRFYLRKLEGAEVLLAFETNFFRQELHKWAPVSEQPPPILEQSLSTRKPRPTKQQRLMMQHGVNTPDELPLQFRTKPYNVAKARKSSEQRIQPAPNKRLKSTPIPPGEESPSFSPEQVNRETSTGPGSDGVLSPTDLLDASRMVPSSHNPHSASARRDFTDGFYAQQASGESHSPYRSQRSSLVGPQASLDPDHFAASSESPFGHTHTQLGDETSQNPEFGEEETSQVQETAVEQMFDEFVSHPGDEAHSHSEAAEALEARGQSEERRQVEGNEQRATP